MAELEATLAELGLRLGQPVTVVDAKTTAGLEWEGARGIVVCRDGELGVYVDPVPAFPHGTILLLTGPSAFIVEPA